MKFYLHSSLPTFVTLFVLSLCMSCSRIHPDVQVVSQQRGYTYRGTLVKGKYEGYGEMRYHGRIVYAGQWVEGKREGKGVSYDSCGQQIVGLWKANTLIHGTRTDSNGVYTGQLNQKGQPDGAGSYTFTDETYYHGYWLQGERSGFGFASSPKKLRLGEWKADRYLGERLVYTGQRIYGIDISRHQHEIGKKHYPIYWNQLRITHLGTISKKHIRGTVSYPISFCYIKSTEGTTIRNRYYKGDYRAAKRSGIHCGAYHFFSTLTSGKAQAKYFLRNTLFQKGDFPPVLDVEPYPSQIAKMGGVKVMFNEVRAWLQLVEKHVGVKPILYISQIFVNKYLPEAPDLMKNYNVWIARYGEYKPNVHLVMWQLSPDGRVKGIKSDVDINIFNGYQDSFEEFLRNERIK